MDEATQDNNNSPFPGWETATYEQRVEMVRQELRTVLERENFQDLGQINTPAAREALVASTFNYLNTLPDTRMIETQVEVTDATTEMQLNITLHPPRAVMQNLQHSPAQNWPRMLAEPAPANFEEFRVKVERLIEYALSRGFGIGELHVPVEWSGVVHSFEGWRTQQGPVMVLRGETTFRGVPIRFI